MASAAKRAQKVKKEDVDSDDEVGDNEVDGLDTTNIIKEEPGEESPTRRSARAAPKTIDYAKLAGIGGDDGEETADTGSNFGQSGDYDD